MLGAECWLDLEAEEKGHLEEESGCEAATRVADMAMRLYVGTVKQSKDKL